MGFEKNLKFAAISNKYQKPAEELTDMEERKTASILNFVRHIGQGDLDPLGTFRNGGGMIFNPTRDFEVTRAPGRKFNPIIYPDHLRPPSSGDFF